MGRPSAPPPRASAPQAGLLRAATAAISIICTTAVLAAPPRLIDASETGLRDDLAWLADRGHIGFGVATWPLPPARIESALQGIVPAGLDAADRDALARIGSALGRLRSGASLGAKINSARHPSAGADAAAHARIEASLQVQGDAGEDTAWRLRAQLQKAPIGRDPSPLGLDGSYVARSMGNAVLGLGAVDRWWGPGRHRSLVLGDAAAPVPALIVVRAVDAAASAGELRWIGPWSYELSIGRPRHYRPRGPSTIGLRLVARPSAHLEIGLSRYLYWGGAGRPRHPNSLFDALVGDSNVDDPGLQGPDPSNELAGIDVRVAAPVGRAAWAGYLQWIGEDEAQGAPSKAMLLLGTQIKHADASMRYEWTAEAADTRLGRYFGFGGDRMAPGYRHSVYLDGHYHMGLPIGASIGGGGVVGSLGLVFVPLDSPDGRRHELRFWAARVSMQGAEPLNTAYGTPGAVQGLLLQTSGATPRWRWQLGLSLQDQPGAGRRSAGLLATLELPIAND